MAKYGSKSEEHLAEVHADLARVMRAVVARFDNQIRDGARSVEEQKANVLKGVSKTMDSKHVVGTGIRNKSDAVDAYPFPVRLPQPLSFRADLTPAQRDELAAHVKDVARFYYFGGYVLATGDAMGVPLRWGGDWDGDRDVHEQSFDDLPHFERADA